MLGDFGRNFLMSENGKDGSKKYASAYLPLGALHCADLYAFINFTKLINLSGF